MSTILTQDRLPPYQYAPLKKGAIRVLHVRPASSLADPVECTITCLTKPWNPRNSRECMSYLTWSYAWGDTFPDGSHLTEGIICDGQWLKVTRHLLDGLKRFRAFCAAAATPTPWYAQWFGRGRMLRYGEMKLWIDAICINQQDVEEKNRQVQMMGDIYRHSTALIVWLGEVKGLHANAALAKFCVHESPDIAKMVVSRLLGRWATHGNALGQIIQSSWFERRWAIQEVAMTVHWQMGSPHIALMGRHAFDLNRMIAWIHSLDEGRKRSNRTKREQLRELDTVGVTWSTTKEPLLVRLNLHREAKCSNNHDLVFALLHTCIDYEELGIKVDYAQNVEDLFLQTAQSIIRSRRTREEPWELLCLSTCHPSTSATITLPSWVPDWRSKITYVCREHKETIDMLSKKDLYRSDDYATVSNNDVTVFDLAGPYLRVRGTVYGWHFHPDNPRCTCHLCKLWKGRITIRGKCVSSDWLKLTKEASSLSCVLFSSSQHSEGPLFVLSKTPKVATEWNMDIYKLILCFLRPDDASAASLTRRDSSVKWSEAVVPLGEFEICIG